MQSDYRPFNSFTYQAGDVICICLDCDASTASVCRRSVSTAGSNVMLVSDGPRGPVRYKGFEYVTLHGHSPTSTTPVNECDNFCERDDGFAPAISDEDSIHVCTSLPWSAHALVFADGSSRLTSIDWKPSLKAGKSTSFSMIS